MVGRELPALTLLVLPVLQIVTLRCSDTWDSRHCYLFGKSVGYYLCTENRKSL